MIQIPQPCTADWKGMTPQQHGRFCSSCEKVVVDFTKMSDEDIKGYFVTYAEQKTCGRFTDTQLNRPLTKKAAYIQSIYTHVRTNVQSSFFKQTFLFFLGTMIWFSSCVRRTPQKIGKIMAVDSSRSSQPLHLTGDTTYIEPLKGKVMYMPEDTTAEPLDTLDQIIVTPEDSSTRLMGKPVFFEGRSKGKKF